MSRYYVIAPYASKPSIFNLESHSVNLGHMGFALFIFALDIFQASCYSAPPLLEKAFSSTMKICRLLVGFIIKDKYFSECCFYLL